MWKTGKGERKRNGKRKYWIWMVNKIKIDFFLFSFHALNWMSSDSIFSESLWTNWGQEKKELTEVKKMKSNQPLLSVFRNNFFFFFFSCVIFSLCSNQKEKKKKYERHTYTNNVFAYLSEQDASPSLMEFAYLFYFFFSFVRNGANDDENELVKLKWFTCCSRF